MLKQISHISAQSDDDVMRFIALGMPKDKITVDGNIKYDFPIADNLLENAQKEHLGSRSL